MNPRHIERAAYLAAHAVLAANVSAPELACPGARRSHAVDTIANVIKSVFEVHSDREEMDGLAEDWSEPPIAARRPRLMLAPQHERSREILHIRAETAAQGER
jgi:hypothetical protein